MLTCQTFHRFRGRNTCHNYKAGLLQHINISLSFEACECIYHESPILVDNLIRSTASAMHYEPKFFIF